MHISAQITGLKYQPFCTANLTEVDFNEFNINSRKTYFTTKNKNFSFSISKWKSPKRTRSYPFERVYNTLGFNKKITVIPVIKDEGRDGDRDYIQWDTISLMSLMDVYVILAYYNYAERNKRYENKATNFKFDNEYVKEKVIEISNYHSSPLHWNLKEIKETLPSLIDIAQESYNHLEKELNVDFHNSRGIQSFKDQFQKGVTDFMNTSRNKAKEAQNRERQTTQPKEFLSTSTKATITIKNYLGGIYYFTTDEIAAIGNELQLIEGKHSRDSILPSIGDIKDGLLKMVLYCNLTDVKVNEINFTPKPVLKLTSTNISGRITSNSASSEIDGFKTANNFNKNHIYIIENLFIEAQTNNFEVIIESV